jgi:hypothetical protein
MKLTSRLLVFCSLVFWVHPAAHGQRLGYSIGMSSPGSAGSTTSAPPRGPALPPLPAPLPSNPANSTGQLKSLNLSSEHLAPPPLNLPPAGNVPGRTRILPPVPYPMDPILKLDTVSGILDKPGMCTNSSGSN